MSSSDILVNYSYLGPGGNIAGATVLPILCIAAVGARFWGRVKAKAGLRWDDWLIFVSLALYIGMAICIIIGVSHHALGYATPKPPPNSPSDEFLYFTSPKQTITGRLEYAILWMQVWQLGLAKASVVMFYRRIFDTPNKTSRWFHYSTLSLLILIGLWTIGFFLTLLFTCGTNFLALWTTVIALIEDCPEGTLGQMSYAVCDFATDILIIAQPLPMVWKLHMATKRKWIISGAFLLGALAAAASCLRMAIYIIVDISFVNPRQDGDWTVDLFIFWSIVESGLTILAACLPSLLFIWQNLGVLARSVLNSIRSTSSMQSLHLMQPEQGVAYTATARRNSADSRLNNVGPCEDSIESRVLGREETKSAHNKASLSRS